MPVSRCPECQLLGAHLPTCSLGQAANTRPDSTASIETPSVLARARITAVMGLSAGIPNLMYHGIVSHDDFPIEGRSDPNELLAKVYAIILTFFVFAAAGSLVIPIFRWIARLTNLKHCTALTLAASLSAYFLFFSGVTRHFFSRPGHVGDMDEIVNPVFGLAVVPVALFAAFCVLYRFCFDNKNA